eukprot:g789.t1
MLSFCNRTVLILLAASASASGPKNIITILIDDLGSYDTAVNNEAIVHVTPNLAQLSHTDGLRLQRFYTYKYCSPTRRAFLSGRFPVHMSGMQAQPCDNTLPMELTILPEKLKQAAVPWKTHFVGKGHLGYPTTDHLPIQRGFDSHIGYLCGAEDYDHGFNENRDPTHDCAGTPKSCVYDFWNDHAPGATVHNEVVCMLRMCPPPAWEKVPNGTGGFWDATFGDMLHVVDAGIGNLTATLKEQGMWDDTLMIVTSDNGGIGPGNNFPFRGHKATPWEGGTRVMGFLSGGFLPLHLRGKTFSRAIGVQDWYPTICNFAGVDPSDNVTFDNVSRPIDGVDVWPAILAGQDSYLHEYLPTTENSILWQERWKLITAAENTFWYSPNNTHTLDNRTTWPCRDSTPTPSPPAPAKCNTTVAGYNCHAATYCGPRKSFYAARMASSAEECAALCTANVTGCGCFDFRETSGGGTDEAACRLHANKGTGLTKSGAGYSAFVKFTTAEIIQRRADIDARAEEEKARLMMASNTASKCSVCTASQPCLFDLLNDPGERVDIAKVHPDIVARLQSKLNTFAPYIGKKMTPSQYEQYECVKDIRPWWGNFSGPCCKRKAVKNDATMKK